MNRTLRTAIATLIAALSVAVMIGAAPANASVGSSSASLSSSPTGGLNDVVVSGVARTSSYSEAQQLLGRKNGKPAIKGTCPICGG